MSLRHDPTADFLTRIRNGLKARKSVIKAPTSKLKVEIAKVLEKEGYINGYEVIGDVPKQDIVVKLKYKGRIPSISGIKTVSKTGMRVYAKSQQMPRVLSGLGIAIISTPKGLITNKEAQTQNVGGEVIAYVW